MYGPLASRLGEFDHRQWVHHGLASLCWVVATALLSTPALAHPGHYFTTTDPGPIPGIGTSELVAAGVVLVSIPLVGTIWYVRRRRMATDESERE